MRAGAELRQVGRGEHHAGDRHEPAHERHRPRAFAEEDGRQDHADERVGRAHGRDDGDGPELQRPVMRHVRGRRERRVHGEPAERAQDDAGVVTAGEHEDRHDRRARALGNEHHPEAPEPPRGDGPAEVRQAPARARRRGRRSRGSGFGERVDRHGAARSPTSSGFASSDVSRSRRSCAARAIAATADATAREVVRSTDRGRIVRPASPTNARACAGVSGAATNVASPASASAPPGRIVMHRAERARRRPRRRAPRGPRPSPGRAPWAPRRPRALAASSTSAAATSTCAASAQPQSDAAELRLVRAAPGASAFTATGPRIVAAAAAAWAGVGAVASFGRRTP